MKLSFKRSKSDDSASDLEAQSVAPTKEKKEKKPKSKGRASKAPKGKKQFVLMVGDEGAILVYLDGKKVEKRLYAPGFTAEQTGPMRALLESDSKAPISLLLDSMDQSYSRHTFPPVAKFSLGNIIKRRIERDYPNEEMTGALPLGREKGGRKDWLFLLVAVNQSEALQAWITLCLDLPNPFKGVFLSPAEGEFYIKQIAEALKKTPATFSRDNADAGGRHWQLLVSHHKVGGFRQIVLKDGALVFTRLAQPINDAEPQIVAGSVEQELVNTVEYLKRLGLEDNPQLDVYMITSQAIREALDSNNLPGSSQYLLTPHDVAEAMGLGSLAMPEDQFGDIVMAGSFGLRTKRRLKLGTRLSKKIEAFMGARMAIRAVAGMIAVACLGYTAYAAVDVMNAMEEQDTLERQRNAAQASLSELEEKMKVYPDTLDKILDVVQTYETLASKEEFFPETVLGNVYEILTGHANIEEIDWHKTTSTDSNSGAVKAGVEVKIKFEIVRRDAEASDIFKTRSKNIIKDLETGIKMYDVTFTTLPDYLKDNEALQTSFGADADNPLDKAQTIPIEISLKAPKAPDNNMQGGF